MAQEKLTDQQINGRLKKLEGWTREGESIQRTLEFETFSDAIDFIIRIADHAEDADHHPEIFNVYNRVELTLTTHDVGGLTEKDFDLAEDIDGEVEV